MISLGWKKGQGLRPNSINKPILINQKKDNKGLGYNPQASEGWWERVFDGHLKSLGVSSNDKGVSFKFDEEQMRRSTSPLYAAFISDGVLSRDNEESTVVALNKDKKQKKEKKDKKKSKKSESKTKKSSNKDKDSKSKSKKRKRDHDESSKKKRKSEKHKTKSKS